MKTKNLWVSTGAHIFNDWFLFSLPLIAAALTAGPK
jgi:membrane protease YdiL (CAAX protease family)